MDFCWVTLRVINLEDSVKFYHEIMGIPISSRFKGNGTEIVMLGDADKPKIELLCDGDKKTDNPGAGISIGILVDSLDRMMEYLKDKQIPVTKGPFAPNPHVRFFFVNDPDGFEVQLVERC